MSENKWTPKVIREEDERLTVTFALRVRRCEICKRLCMCVGKDYQNRLFWHDDSQKDQMKRAGIVKEAFYSDGAVCEECKGKGLVKFTCYLCGKEQESTQIEETYGDSAEFLCKTCYETVPAKTWEEAKEKLRDAHQWDFS